MEFSYLFDEESRGEVGKGRIGNETDAKAALDIHILGASVLSTKSADFSNMSYSTDQTIKAGVVGTILAVIVNFINPVPLSFLPTFIIAILVIALYGIFTFKDGLIAALLIYIFDEGILTSLYLGLLYLANMPYPTPTIDSTIIFSPVLSAISAVIAASLGVALAKKRAPLSQRQQLQPSDILRDIQTVS